MCILKICDGSFSYDRKKLILNNINVSFKRGVCYGIFGKSGTGKTTFLSLLAGLDTLTSGCIFYDGNDISKMNKDKYRSNDIGVIFQSFNLLPHLTALENVLLAMDISNNRSRNKKQDALSLLKKVGIDEVKAKRRVLHLSGGEQQRVAIARALSYNPKVILADEVTGNLDKDTERDIVDILKRLAHDDDKCIIIISHSDYVKENVDKVLFLKSGNLKEN